jgi:ribosome biogenesis protein ENP2
VGREAVEVTALSFDSDGLTYGVGTSSGHCLLYDLRSSHPLICKEHQYSLPIVNITFHNTSRKILSSDAKIIKIWERDDAEGRERGTIMTNVETPADMKDVCLVSDKRGDSGLILAAGEQERVMAYYVPALGPAPRWCSFLDSITEELEEDDGTTVYDDYRFVTKQEVEELNAANLVGTPLLRGYMHGYFMDVNLYNKLKAVSEPFAYEEWRKKKLREKLEAKRTSRISIKKKLPKVRSIAFTPWHCSREWGDDHKTITRLRTSCPEPWLSRGLRR